MSGGELTLAVALSIIAGGYVGCVIDRWRRRPPGDELPKHWVSEVRMNRMHVIKDEWLNGRKEDEQDGR